MKIVLAYSGGLDTSVILKWLKETYQAEVIAFSADLGQEEDWEAVEEKALQTGASKVFIQDLKEEFVEDYVFPAFRANAAYEQAYLLGTSLARPIIAKHQVLVAEAEGAEAVSHGATGKGNDQVRFELTYMALNPALKIIAPWREWDLNSRTALIDYARETGDPRTGHRPPGPTAPTPTCCTSATRAGYWKIPGANLRRICSQMTQSPEKAPDQPEYLEIDFRSRAIPWRSTGNRSLRLELLARLNQVGGTARDRPGGSGGKPLRGDEVPGGL